MINISEKMRDLMKALHEGPEELNGIDIPEVYAECEDEWNEHYAIICGVVPPDLGGFMDEPYVTVDYDQFENDLRNLVESYFKDETQIDIRFYPKSQEIEVHRRGEKTGGE